MSVSIAMVVGSTAMVFYGALTTWDAFASPLFAMGVFSSLGGMLIFEVIDTLKWRGML